MASIQSPPASPASELSLWTERSVSRLLSQPWLGQNTWQQQSEEGGGYLGSLFQETGSNMVGKVWQQEQEGSRGMDTGVPLAFAFLWNSKNGMTHT